MKINRVVKVYYSPSYAASKHAFDTTRKARWIAASLADDPIERVELVEPVPVTEELFCRVHAPEYVGAVESGEPRGLAESQGFRWDAGVWEMVAASNGGVVAAALEAPKVGISGSLSSGLHHARRERGAGFCTFNGLALAARQAQTAGAKNILILDVDAHCGGGTASLIGDKPRIWQLDIATDRFDSYADSERIRLRVVDSASDYLPTLEKQLSELGKTAPRFDLCLYNAGMDPFEGCDIGGLPGITKEVLAQRERIVFEWCRDKGTNIAFVLAGGYTGSALSQRELVQLHRLTLQAAAESVVTVRQTWTQHPTIEQMFPTGEPENILFTHPDLVPSLTKPARQPESET